MIYMKRTGTERNLSVIWEFSKNKYEVDFVYDDSRTVNPIEVKYQKQPSTADIKELKEFINMD